MPLQHTPGDPFPCLEGPSSHVPEGLHPEDPREYPKALWTRTLRLLVVKLTDAEPRELHVHAERILQLRARDATLQKAQLEHVLTYFSHAN